MSIVVVGESLVDLVWHSGADARSPYLEEALPMSRSGYTGWGTL